MFLAKSVQKICEIRKNCVPLQAISRESQQGSGFSAVGSAHVWGARGRWFESSNPDQKKRS